jgi:hypothetical protein
LATDHLKISFNGPSIAKILKDQGRPVTGQVDAQQVATESLYHSNVAKKVASAVASFTSHLTTIKASIPAHTLTLGAPSNDLSQKLNDLASALNPSAAGTFQVVNPAHRTSSKDANSFQKGMAKQGLAEHLQTFKAAVMPATVDIAWSLTVLRDPDAARTPDSSPISVLSESSTDLAAIQTSASTILSQINQADAEIQNFGPTVQKLWNDSVTVFKKDLADDAINNNPKNAVVQAAMSLLSELQALQKTYSGANITTLIPQIPADLNKVDADSTNLQTAISGLSTEATQATLKTALQKAETDLVTAWKTDSASVQLILDAQALFNSLQADYEQIDQITGTTTGSLDSLAAVTIQNDNGKFNSVQLRSEDMIAIAVQAKPEDGKTDFVKLPPVTNLYAFKPALFNCYTANTTVAIGLVDNNDSVWRAGAGHFATLHPVTKQAQINMNVGFGIGIGTVEGVNTTPAAGGGAPTSSTTPSTAAFLGLTLFRDHVVAGWGRNFTTNQTFFFIGLRIATN